jgi:hypothetical protein
MAFQKFKEKKMALIKNIEGETGATAQYWRVIEVNMNYFASIGAVALAGYLTKAARNNGKRPLDARQFPLQGESFDAFQDAALAASGDTPVKAAYKFIKNYVSAEGQPANPFLDAVDD